MALTPEHVIAAIRAYVTDWARPDADILADLNAETIPNPVPQAQLVKRMVPIELFGFIADATMRKRVADWPALVNIRSDIEAQAYSDVLGWLAIAQATEKLRPDEYAACVAYVRERQSGTATYPDPDWRPRVGWAEVNIGRPASLNDVSDSRPEDDA